MKKLLYIIPALLISLQIISCKTPGVIETLRDEIKMENEKFLNPDKKVTEVFRVLLTSDEYRVVELKNDTTMERAKTKGGINISPVKF